VHRGWWKEERNVAGELPFAKKNVVAKLALLLKACGSAVREWIVER